MRRAEQGIITHISGNSISLIRPFCTGPKSVEIGLSVEELISGLPTTRPATSPAIHQDPKRDGPQFWEPSRGRQKTRRRLEKERKRRDAFDLHCLQFVGVEAQSLKDSFSAPFALGADRSYIFRRSRLHLCKPSGMKAALTLDPWMSVWQAVHDWIWVS